MGRAAARRGAGRSWARATTYSAASAGGCGADRCRHETQAALTERVAAHRRNLIPARAAALDDARTVELFVAMAEEVQTTVARVASEAEVPAEVARYLAAENLPAELVMAPDPGLDAIPWQERPLLRIRRGRAEPGDAVSLTPCLAAIAETGTLMLVSGADTPTTLNFLPDTHIVVAARRAGRRRLRGCLGSGARQGRDAGDPQPGRARSI